MRREVYLGIDLGTSSLKVLALRRQGGRLRPVGFGRAGYATHTPAPGRAEQDPRAWWRALRRALAEALSGLDPASVAGLGLSGQMHGLVLCDAEGRPLGPAITWADGRGAEVAQAFYARLPPAFWPSLGGRPEVGFGALTLFWLQQEAPALLERARLALPPKDWLRWALTGEAATEPSDASGLGLLRVGDRRWDTEALERLGLPETLLPRVLPGSAALAGRLSRQAARALGLEPGLPVAAGAADQAAAALGQGVLEPGEAQLLLGSGGQALQVLASPEADPSFRTHLFCHALEGRWYRLAAVLNLGTALAWAAGVLRRRVEALFRLAEASPPGARGVLFIPYLLGERTPHMDPALSGGWVGLRAHHTPADLARALLEGVAFALREALAALPLPEGAPVRVGGGGARHPFWLGLLAGVLGRPLEIAAHPEASAWGAGLLALMALGVGLEAGLHIPVASVLRPGAEARLYEGLYAHWVRARDALAALPRGGLDR